MQGTVSGPSGQGVLSTLHYADNLDTPRNNEFRKAWLRDFFKAQKWYTPNQLWFLTGEWKNDTELTDPSKAVGLLEEVQSMGEIRVNVVRGGKPQTYTYTVR